jgi:hypothetical protein
MGVPTSGDRHAHVHRKHGNGVWQRAMIIRILTNETYTGIWYVGKTKMVDDGKHRKPKPKCGLGNQAPRSREESIPVKVPVTIDADTFAFAQKKKAENCRLLRMVPEHNYLHITVKSHSENGPCRTARGEKNAVVGIVL